MSLTDQLQKGLVHGPTSRKFDLQIWLNLINDYSSTDDVDVIALGALFANALEEVRRALGFVTDERVAAAQKRRALVGLVNRDCLLSEIIFDEAARLGLEPGDTVPLDPQAGFKITLGGGAFTPDEIAQSLVDTLDKLLRMPSVKPSSEPSLSADIDWNTAARDLNVAIAYVSIESAWMDIVWNAFRITSRRPMTLARTIAIS